MACMHGRSAWRDLPSTGTAFHYNAKAAFNWQACSADVCPGTHGTIAAVPTEPTAGPQQLGCPLEALEAGGLALPNYTAGYSSGTVRVLVKRPSRCSQ